MGSNLVAVKWKLSFYTCIAEEAPPVKSFNKLYCVVVGTLLHFSQIWRNKSKLSAIVGFWLFLRPHWPLLLPVLIIIGKSRSKTWSMVQCRMLQIAFPPPLPISYCVFQYFPFNRPESMVIINISKLLLSMLSWEFK